MVFVGSGPSGLHLRSIRGRQDNLLLSSRAVACQRASSFLIACDDYYRSGWLPNARYGFDTVDAIDAAELRLQLSAAEQRTRCADRHAHARGRLQIVRPSYDLVLVEGSYGPQLLLEAVPLSLVVYIETPVVQRLIRRLLRDVRERQRPAQYVIRQMLQQMLPGERRFIHPLKNRADVIVRGYNWDLVPVLSRIE